MARGSNLKKLFSPGKAGGGFVAPVIFGIILLFFYTNGAIYFGALWAGFQPIILLYIIILVVSFALAPSLLTTDPKAPIWLEFLVYAVPAVIINFFILLAGLRLPLGPTSGDYVAMVGLQVAVSGTEEMFFRGALNARFTKAKTGPLYAALVSSALFAGFHAYAYGLNPATIIFAFVAGMLFWGIYVYTKDDYGLAVNSGIHLGYNLALLGVSLIPFFLF